MKKKILLIIGVILVVFAVWAALNREKFTQAVVDLGMALTSTVKHRDPSSEKAKFTLTAAAFSNEYKVNAAEAAKKFINQTVLLEGEITAVSGITVSLNNIACNVDSLQAGKLKDLKTGSKIKLQGLVVGYNDLMEEINLAQCSIK